MYPCCTMATIFAPPKVSYDFRLAARGALVAPHVARVKSWETSGGAKIVAIMSAWVHTRNFVLLKT